MLESIDYPAEPLDEFFRKRYGLLGQHRFPLQPLAAVPDQDIPKTKDKPLEYPPQKNAPDLNWERQKSEIAQFLDAMGDFQDDAPHFAKGGQGGLNVGILLESRGTLPKSQAYQIAQATRLDGLNGQIEAAEREEQSEPTLLDDEELPNTAFRDKLRRFKQLQGEESEVLTKLKNLLWDSVLRPPPEPSLSPANTGGDFPLNASGQPLEPMLGIPRWQWLHLVELWDYLAPCPKTSEHTQQQTQTTKDVGNA